VQFVVELEEDVPGELAAVVGAAAALFHRNKITPYDGLEVAGRVRATYLRGRKVLEAGRRVGPPGGDTLLARR
jgi:hypothetical protein